MKHFIVTSVKGALCLFFLGIVQMGVGATISYTYDSLNRLTNVDYGDGSVISYSYDAAGNRLAYSGVGPIGTNAPIVAIASPTNASVYSTSQSSITLGGTVSDSVGVVQVAWANDRGGAGLASGTATWSAAMSLQTGANVITITANDAAGNVATATITVTYALVTIPPTVAISSPLAGQTVTNSPITVTGTSGDSGAPTSGVVAVQVRVNGGAWQACDGTTNWIASVGLASGSNLIEARSQDNAGNFSALASVSVTYTPPSPVGASAAFVQEDAQTRGNWRQAYGAHGYLIADEATNAPAGVTAGPISGHYVHSWADPSSDWRALVKPGVPDQRVAACWASYTSFSIDLDLGSAVSERVGLYCLDYDKFQGGRAQRVDIVDPANSNTLSSQVVSNFVGGKYLVWNVSGKVRIDITSLATNGANAVVSGLFFGPGTNDAAFVAQDAATQGNWKRAYGAQGYLIVGDSTNCPNYTVGPTNGSYSYLWAEPTTKAPALKLPLSSDERIAACWASPTNFSVDFNVGTNAPVRLAVYCLDWDNLRGGRTEQVSILDGASGQTLSSQVVSNFTGGDYVVWEVIGQVRLSVTNLNDANAVVSGVFFGTSRSSARFVGQDLATQGSWQGAYGAEGYVIAGDVTNSSGYTVGPFSGQFFHLWAEPANEASALQMTGIPGERIAACWASYTNFSIDLDTRTNADAQAALYCFDFDNLGGGRAQRVDMVDPESGEVLDSRLVDGFVNGKYLLWYVGGRARINITNIATNSNAVLSGIFLDRPRTIFMPAGGAYDGAVHFLLVGRSWSPYRIEASDDLVNWTPVVTTMNIGGTTEFSEVIIQGLGQRFYRAIELP